MWTQEQFDEWHSHPLTKQFFAFLNERREDLKEKWAEGLNEMSEEEHSIAKVYGDILGLDYEQDIATYYEAEEKEDENDEEIDD